MVIYPSLSDSPLFTRGLASGDENTVCLADSVFTVNHQLSAGLDSEENYGVTHRGFLHALTSHPLFVPPLSADLERRLDLGQFSNICRSLGGLTVSLSQSLLDWLQSRSETGCQMLVSSYVSLFIGANTQSEPGVPFPSGLASSDDGDSDGDPDGLDDGDSDGDPVGLDDGDSADEGNPDGLDDGDSDGDPNGEDWGGLQAFPPVLAPETRINMLRSMIRRVLPGGRRRDGKKITHWKLAAFNQSISQSNLSTGMHGDLNVSRHLYPRGQDFNGGYVEIFNTNPP